MRALIVLCVVFLFASVGAEPVRYCFGRNEVIKCVTECPPERTCKTRDAQFKCAAQDDTKCETKCVCQEGFYRNVRGDCISNEQCDTCTGPHEYFACGSACDNVCETLHEQNQTNCPIVNIMCNQRCYCEEGHARDAGNICVPIEECHLCTGPHEYYACGSACDNVCKTLHEQNQTNCPIVNGICNPMCYCEEGHARDARNVCVPIGECRETCTGPNEEFDPCKKSCPPETCESIVTEYLCDEHEICKPACACEAGFLRKAHGSPCMPTRMCLELENSPDFAK